MTTMTTIAGPVPPILPVVAVSGLPIPVPGYPVSVPSLPIPAAALGTVLSSLVTHPPPGLGKVREAILYRWNDIIR